MEFTVWISLSAPTPATDAPTFPARAAPTFQRRKLDGLKWLSLDSPQELLLPINDVFCMIEYEGASGDLTRRRITMRKVRSGPDVPLIQSICHERRAFREFRADRITAVISEQGEVLDPSDFFRATLPTDVADILCPVDVSTKTKAKLATKEERDLFAAVRPSLTILVACARADHNFHALELDVIEAYLEIEAVRLRAENIIQNPVDYAHIEAIAHSARFMRPMDDTIRDAVAAVAKWSPGRIDRLERAIAKVMRADGILKKSELKFAAEIKRIADA